MSTAGSASAFGDPVHRVLTRDELIQEIRDGVEKEYVLFWGHKGTASVRYFSQWYPAAFNVDGATYRTAEQFMMAEKARLFGDSDVRQEIMLAETPREAKALGRRIRRFTEEAWRQHRTDIVVDGNVAKFKQNEDMMKALMSTGTAVIVEASPADNIWGIGMGAKHPNSRHPESWKGDNLLGFCLMRARDIIATERQATLQAKPDTC